MEKIKIKKNKFCVIASEAKQSHHRKDCFVTSFLAMTLVIAISFLFFVSYCFAQDSLLIDDFEGEISGGPSGTVDFGSGNDSSVKVSASSEVKYSGKQSLKVEYEGLSGGYMWIARGPGLDAKNSSWLVRPENIDWKKYKAISVYIYGNDSKAQIAFDIKDSGNEIWRYLVTDNFKGWKQVVMPFAEFFCRGDWQPDAADKNSVLDFPLKNYQAEPLAVSNGVLYFDRVELI